jgi:hypothetical protein
MRIGIADEKRQAHAASPGGRLALTGRPTKATLVTQFMLIEIWKTNASAICPSLRGLQPK